MSTQAKSLLAIVCLAVGATLALSQGMSAMRDQALAEPFTGVTTNGNVMGVGGSPRLAQFTLRHRW